jgi:hypothetical protein
MLKRVGLLVAIPPVARIPHLQVYFEAIVTTILGIDEIKMNSVWGSFFQTSLCKIKRK